MRRENLAFEVRRKYRLQITSYIYIRMESCLLLVDADLVASNIDSSDVSYVTQLFTTWSMTSEFHHCSIYGKAQA